MSHKTVVIFSLWTSFWSAVFYYLYCKFFSSFGVPWVMFVCLAIFFGMGLPAKKFPSAIISAFCGMAWGQVDFFLMAFFAGMRLASSASDFLSIVVGTFAAMYVHLQLLPNAPVSLMPFIFAGVCLSFSQGGGNIIGLGATFVFGICLAALCNACLDYCSAHFPK